ncbi:hypothetical protein AADR41_04275 [Streptomyces sp. CLV115]|uniref:hypothetical protein n=1 Tax=Streptomyces sp. CLV115 TaxID=3138502 RepID=UPI00313D9184
MAEHPDWQSGSPEPCLSVNSVGPVWAHAMGFLAEQLRGTCPFSYGSTIDFGERIVPESEMTAFCVFAPMVLGTEDCLGIDVGVPGHEAHDVINIQGMYPIHEVEQEFIDEHGIEAFWRSGGNPTDVLRRPAV